MLKPEENITGISCSKNNWSCHLHVRLQALLSCPTASIHTDKPAKDILQVQNTFPLAIDDDLPV